MREQPAQIIKAFTGPTEVFVEAICGPRQHDEHCKGWRWELYLQDAKKRAAAVREEGQKIIARIRAEREAAQLLQAAE